MNSAARALSTETAVEKPKTAGTKTEKKAPAQAKPKASPSKKPAKQPKVRAEAATSQRLSVGEAIPGKVFSIEPVSRRVLRITVGDRFVDLKPAGYKTVDVQAIRDALVPWLSEMLGVRR